MLVVFLLDTGASMNELLRPSTTEDLGSNSSNHNGSKGGGDGLTKLEIAKAFVEQFLTARRSCKPIQPESYILATYNGIHSGQRDSSEYLLQQLKLIQARDRAGAGSSFAKIFSRLSHIRMSEDLDTPGHGRYAQEMDGTVIFWLTDGERRYPASSPGYTSINDVQQQVLETPGANLYSTPFRWDQKLCMLLLGKGGICDPLYKLFRQQMPTWNYTLESLRDVKFTVYPILGATFQKMAPIVGNKKVHALMNRSGVNLKLVINSKSNSAKYNYALMQTNDMRANNRRATTMYPIPESYHLDPASVKFPPRESYPTLIIGDPRTEMVPFPSIPPHLPFDKRPIYSYDDIAELHPLMERGDECVHVSVPNKPPFGLLKYSRSSKCYLLYLFPFNFPASFGLLTELGSGNIASGGESFRIKMIDFAKNNILPGYRPQYERLCRFPRYAQLAQLLTYSARLPQSLDVLAQQYKHEAISQAWAKRQPASLEAHSNSSASASSALSLSSPSSSSLLSTSMFPNGLNSSKTSAGLTSAASVDELLQTVTARIMRTNLFDVLGDLQRSIYSELLIGPAIPPPMDRRVSHQGGESVNIKPSMAAISAVHGNAIGVGQGTIRSRGVKTLGGQVSTIEPYGIHSPLDYIVEDGMNSLPVSLMGHFNNITSLNERAELRNALDEEEDIQRRHRSMFGNPYQKDKQSSPDNEDEAAGENMDMMAGNTQRNVTRKRRLRRRSIPLNGYSPSLLPWLGLAPHQSDSSKSQISDIDGEDGERLPSPALSSTSDFESMMTDDGHDSPLPRYSEMEDGEMTDPFPIRVPGMDEEDDAPLPLYRESTPSPPPTSHTTAMAQDDDIPRVHRPSLTTRTPSPPQPLQPAPQLQQTEAGLDGYADQSDSAMMLESPEPESQLQQQHMDSHSVSASPAIEYEAMASALDRIIKMLRTDSQSFNESQLLSALQMIEEGQFPRWTSIERQRFLRGVSSQAGPLRRHSIANAVLEITQRL